MAGLEATFADAPHISVENFTWSPVHIVQRFENNEMPRPDRIVLVGAAAVTRKPGAVEAYRWTGGSAPELAVQDRVYEAVTGIVDLENTLMIGEYFKAWPKDCFTVEADFQPDAFGRLVIADSEGWVDDDQAVRLHLGFSPTEQCNQIIRTTAQIARHGKAASVLMGEKSPESLTPVSPFIENRAIKRTEGAP